MKTYLLGYKNAEDNGLTQFENATEADLNSEEWVKVEAESLEDAKNKYEQTFTAWQEKLNKELY